MKCLFVFLLATLPAGAAIIDQLAVSVGTQAITQSEITSDIHLAALVNGSAIDETLTARRASAGRLVEQALVRREMTFGSYPQVPESATDGALVNTEKALGGPAALDAKLKLYDLTRKELRDYLKWQLELLRFIDLRFRPAVQVTNEEIEKYYQKNLASAQSSKTPDLSEVRSQIEQRLTGERVDEQLDRWIQQSRRHTVVRFEDPQLDGAANGVESHR